MSEYTLVPAQGSEERGEVASYLLALADEKGLDRRLIKRARGGYLVPLELLDESEVVVTSFVEVAKVDDGADHVARERDVDVTTDETGALYVELRKEEEAGEVDREVIREWLKANGYEPAEKGALKKAHLEAYHAAN